MQLFLMSGEDDSGWSNFGNYFVCFRMLVDCDKQSHRNSNKCDFTMLVDSYRR